MLWPRSCSDRQRALFQPRPMSNSICKRCTGYGRAFSQRTDCGNQSDSAAFFWSAASSSGKDCASFARRCPDILLPSSTDVLSPRMVRVVADLAGDRRQLDERIEPVTDEIETLAKSDDGCRRVMTVPGIGPIISSAMVAAIGNGAAFARGRDFSAWIGLVPKQMSTGDRTILGRITKRGNGYLRTLFVQAARVILLRPASWPKHSFGIWLARAAQRLHRNRWLAALANKLWHGSPGRCWHKSAVMRRASSRQTAVETAQVHQKGSADGSSDPKAIVSFPAEVWRVLKEEMEKRSRQRVNVIRWPFWPSRPRRE